MGGGCYEDHPGNLVSSVIDIYGHVAPSRVLLKEPYWSLTRLGAQEAKSEVPRVSRSSRE